MWLAAVRRVASETLISMHHLDTSIVVAYLRGDREIAQRLQAKLPDVGISSIVLAELLFGAKASARPDENSGDVRNLTSAVQVIDFDRLAADAYGSIRLSLQKRGLPIGEADMLIAAAALSRGAVLVTHNRKHFELVEGLNLEDWLE